MRVIVFRFCTLIEGRNEKKVLLITSHCDPENEFVEVSIKFTHLAIASKIGHIFLFSSLLQSSDIFHNSAVNPRGCPRSVTVLNKNLRATPREFGCRQCRLLSMQKAVEVKKLGKFSCSNPRSQIQ